MTGEDSGQLHPIPACRACKYGEKRAHVVSANIGPRVSRTADVLGNGRAALRLRIFACVYCARRGVCPLEGKALD